MKTTIAVLAFAVISTIASDAGAQVIFPSGPPTGMPSAAVSPAEAPSYVPPYSYTVAYQRSQPARIYVGYGDDLFPFYGQPYGKPTDAWSWSAMSSSPYGGTLARYYYPPVR